MNRRSGVQSAPGPARKFERRPSRGGVSCPVQPVGPKYAIWLEQKRVTVVFSRQLGLGRPRSHSILPHWRSTTRSAWRRGRAFHPGAAARGENTRSQNSQTTSVKTTPGCPGCVARSRLIADSDLGNRRSSIERVIQVIDYEVIIQIWLAVVSQKDHVTDEIVRHAFLSGERLASWEDTDEDIS
jgi:hypothetical protein